MEVRDDVRAMRNEADIFSDLALLCRSAGYIHAVAYLCFRDNAVSYAGELLPKDILRMFSPDRLIRTEISTLIGLMIQGGVNRTMPSPADLQIQLDRTETLLKELHETFLPSPQTTGSQDSAVGPPDINKMLGFGQFMREAIFYAGESAYTFQYRDLAPQKYAADEAWLRVKKGFTISEARDVVSAIAEIQEQKLMATMVGMQALPPEQWSFLPAYTFVVSDIEEACRLPKPTIEAVLDAFALAPGERNESFRAIDDFNIANAMPLLRVAGGFVLLQFYSLVEALYESPFYWMAVDNSYAPKALQNRGRFTEAFCQERLERIFGTARVHINVNIFESKAKRAGEIDVLVLFGDRAVVLQAKSKRLTLKSRKGNDGQIRDDFKKSVQDSYDQGLICAKKLSDPRTIFVGSDGEEIVVPQALKEIYVLCVVSDHYPSLQFQARQFLRYEQTDVIQPPVVLDVFTLDAITEMLPSPLRFLSYINRRARYTERLHAAHELVILSYHLKRNLWVDDDVGMLMLSDDLTADLDVAMAARRDGVPGRQTPDGVLTRTVSTAVGRILAAIEALPDPGVIDFGFLLLSLNEETITDASKGIKRIVELARRDGQSHDITLGIRSTNSGFTVHCNSAPVPIAELRLRNHCERRKYSERAKTWFGICIDPTDGSIRFGLSLDYEWGPDSRLEALTAHAPRSGTLAQALASTGRRRKVGRNDMCPCGSGRKYKKCHG